MHELLYTRLLDQQHYMHDASIIGRKLCTMLDVILLNSQLTKFLTVDGFHAHLTRPKAIDSTYVDGVSITYAIPRKHIWTYTVHYRV